MRKKIALIMSAMAPLCGFAQEKTDSAGWDVLNLDEVVITATRVPKLLKDSPVQTRVITSKDIERSDATDIMALLETELPGVEFSYAMNQQVHLNFGGFDGQNVLFLVDGERLAGETMDDVDFSRIVMSDVERIEIVRGASSAVYGSNAAGGVVNIITKGATKKVSADLSFRTARHNERRYIAGLYNKWKNLQNNLSLTASRMDSYDVKSAPDPATRVVSDIYGHKTLNVKEQFSVSPATGLKLTARGAFFMRQLPREVDAPERYRSFSGGLRGEWNVSAADRIELSYAFDQYDKSQYRYVTGADIRNYSNVQNSFRGLYHHYFSGKDILTFGADYVRDYLLNSKLANTRISQDKYDAFVQYDRSFGKKWEVVGALRYDYSSDGHHSHFVPRLSARFSPMSCLNMRGSYGMGFRAPSLKEKYYEFDMAGIWIVKGNPGLKPEVSHNLNLSAEYTRSHYNVTAAAFYNYIRNRITTGLPYYAPGEDNQLFLDYINLNNYHSLGAELTAQCSWNCGLSTKLSYSYTHEYNVRDRDGNEANNQYMPARPHSLTCRINWQHSVSEKYSFDIGLSGRALSAVSNQEYKDYYNLSVGTVKVEYPAYSIWKLSFVQTINRKLKISLALDNLLNYRPKYYYLNAPLTDGINLMAGISLKI